MNTCTSVELPDQPLKCKYIPVTEAAKTAIYSQTIDFIKCNCLNIYFINISVKVTSSETGNKKVKNLTIYRQIFIEVRIF